MAITKIDAATETFDGFARVILFPDVDPADFTDSTTLADVITGGKDLGQIVEDSPSWDGEDADVEVLRDTEGGVIRALPTPGTFAWSCRVASTSAAMSKAIAGAKLTETTAATVGDVSTPAGKSVIGLNPGNMTKRCPIGVLNKTKNRLMLFPKASVNASPTYEDDMVEYNLSATAEDVATTALSTMMFIPLASNPLEAAGA
ncbi:hypothetical protein [uncultured Alistipes sp.]|uniref:hypothetical protein n=1 Tax=uncultured Alistipes sp. TaxID=538949 RepID=UPI00260951F2|nr:hypothetical protein [uncultured Alistipes sp.]